MRRIGNLLFLIIVGVGIYVYRGPILIGWGEVFSRYFPCKQPISYSVGSFDARFGISESDFLKAISEAEAIWEKPLGREFFSRTPEGKLKVNLIYDYRQEATEKLRSLGLSVDDDQESYDALTARYRSLKAQLETKQAIYETLVAAVEERSSAYNEKVASWNRRKGAPPEVVAQLREESVAIKVEADRVRAMSAELQGMVEDINAMVTVINKVANNINATAEEFNRIGRERGQEFTEGLYTKDRTGQKIDIYQFNDRNELVRVLAHELGHALSLDHVEDPKAIMYRLNQGANAVLTDADIAAIKARCRIE